MQALFGRAEILELVELLSPTFFVVGVFFRKSGGGSEGGFTLQKRVMRVNTFPSICQCLKSGVRSDCEL